METNKTNKDVRYLFFDLEEASSAYNHIYICEFGYVLTDENFKVLEQDNFIINPCLPRREWDWFAVRKILTRTIEQYENCLDFNHFYPHIVRHIKDADYVFGHTTDSDVEALNQEIRRHDHEPLDFTFYDIKEFYKAYIGKNKSIGLSTMVDELHIEDGTEIKHDALADAYNTMLCMKKMLSDMNVSLEELIDLSKDARFGKNIQNVSTEITEKKLEDTVDSDSKKLAIDDGTNELCNRHRHNLDMYLIYLDNIKINNDGIFKDKKISISLNYEQDHYRQSLNLIRLIAERGGQIILKASLADIVVEYDLVSEDGSIRKDTRVNYALEAINNGSKIEIITFDEFLNRIGISEGELDSMDYPSFDFMYEDDAIIKNSKIRNAIKRTKERNKAAN